MTARLAAGGWQRRLLRGGRWAEGRKAGPRRKRKRKERARVTGRVTLTEDRGPGTHARPRHRTRADPGPALPRQRPLQAGAATTSPHWPGCGAAADGEGAGYCGRRSPDGACALQGYRTVQGCGAEVPESWVTPVPAHPRTHPRKRKPGFGFVIYSRTLPPPPSLIPN